MEGRSECLMFQGSATTEVIATRGGGGLRGGGAGRDLRDRGDVRKGRRRKRSGGGGGEGASHQHRA